MYLPPDVCIYIMYTYQMQDMYNTCCFPSRSASQPSSIPLSYPYPADLKQMGPPLCAVALLKAHSCDRNMYTTCCFPSRSASHPSSIPLSYPYPADLKQMGPPLCAVVLLKVPS